MQQMAVSGRPGGRGDLKIYESLDDLTTDFADYIAQLSELSVKERGVFAIALSGGSLIGVMGKLCEAPYNQTVDWTKWHVFWADERVVSKNHVDSNYKLAKDGLLSKGIFYADWALGIILPGPLRPSGSCSEDLDSRAACSKL